MNDKFKLELKAASPDQCREWVAILEAKRQLHNIDKLVQVSNKEFKTKTFQSLLLLSEVDQVSCGYSGVLFKYTLYACDVII